MSLDSLFRPFQVKTLKLPNRVVMASREQIYPGVAPGSVDSPSGISSPGKRFGEPMSDAAIADTIAAFTRAAVNAKSLGFDAIELHGAHGYLIGKPTITVAVGAKDS